MKKTVTITLIIALFFGMIGMPKEASAKSVYKVTKVITLTNKSQSRIIHSFKVAPNEKVAVKMEVLSVSKKAKKSDLYIGYYDSEDSMGVLFSPDTKPKLKKSSLKKGSVLVRNENDYCLTGNTEVDYQPFDGKGIKKLKIRITYYTKSGKSGIASFKEIKE